MASSTKIMDDIENLLLSVKLANINVSEGIVEGEFKKEYNRRIQETFEDNLDKWSLESMSQDQNIDSTLEENLKSKTTNSDAYRIKLAARQKLPCFSMKTCLLETISKNQVVVVSGETGCGKTTQIVQYVLDEAILEGRGSICNIMCTQPRRLSAISVAERVAFERDEPLGESVGYHIRLERVFPKQERGAILFMTTGILLQCLQSNPTLNGVSHVFLDEVHERDIFCDLVVTCLKKVIDKRKDLKIVIMSATVNPETFSSYFGNAPRLNINGFTFPVQEIYLDRVLQMTNFKYQCSIVQRPRLVNKDFHNVIIPYVRKLEMMHEISFDVGAQLRNPLSEQISIELIASVIQYICLHEKEGAILVFVPGMNEINQIIRQLESRTFFQNPNYVILPLHSTLSTNNQKEIFSKAPIGGRKIIISTNIAETSITIDDVVFVVDSGFVNVTNFKGNLSTLDTEWVCLSSARQRRGRAGRVEPGKCYKLYTKAREMQFQPYPTPEIQRASLDEVVLRIKMLQLGKAGAFLKLVMDPPDDNAVKLSLKILRNLNAIDENENLTPLGYHLAKLPLDPQTGKMILMAAMFGCVDPILTIAAALNFKDPFVGQFRKKDEVKDIKKKLAHGEESDHYVLCAAMKEWELALQQNDQDFSYDNFLSDHTLHLLSDMKGETAQYLHDMNFLKTPDPKDINGNANSDNVELVKAIVCSGLYPNVAIFQNYFRSKKIYKTAQHQQVRLHDRSICSEIISGESYLVYHKMVKSSQIFIHDATIISPWPLLFFGERFDILNFIGQKIRVDNLIEFNCSTKTARLIQELRSHMNGILEGTVANPEVIDWSGTSEKVAILKAIISLFTTKPSLN